MQRSEESKILVKTEYVKAVPFITFVTAIAVTLYASLGLHELAETTGIYHAAQHVLIFLGGAGAATSLGYLYKRKEK